jgi:DNA-binding winged helix-turn-helix (wHTH) protein/Tol biopolymer transport system component
MRWQIAEFIFCDKQQTLTFEDNLQQLEPMMVELLSYFCKNADQIISKDKLIEQVWLGRIVSDNAVSKLITKLRKTFGDDVRQPKFIATFPKKGYRFIALVTPIIAVEIPTSMTGNDSSKSTKLSEEQLEYKNTTQNKTKLFFSRVFALILFVIITVYSMFFHKGDKETLAVLTHAKALTAAAGNEFFPSVSPDGMWLAFKSIRNDHIRLIIKNINDQRMIDIKHEADVSVGPASWSFDGRLLVYLVSTPERCQYFIRSIKGSEVGEAKLIHNCPAGSYGTISFTHDNNKLVFAQNEGVNSPYSLFEINLITEEVTRLTQPEIFLDGNSQFDLHPTENKLLISSPDKQQWEGFYSLDLETDELQLLFKQDAYICCGVWDHDGTRVVLMGEHPAYQLLSYNLAGKDMEVIYSGSRKIIRPTRHTNGQDYLFTSGQYNANIHIFDNTSKKQRVLVDASVDDRLATFASQSKSSVRKIAYVSLATGNEEIWLTDTENSQRVKLTSFNDGRHYVDLKWSPDNKFLMALTLNEIHIINSKTGTFERLKIPQTEIRAVSFKGNKILSYSSKSQNQSKKQWNVYFYQLDTHSIIPTEKKWQYIQFDSEKDNTLWVDQNNKLYWGIEQYLVKAPQLLSVDFLSGRIFNLKKRNENWFWSEVNKSRSLINYSAKSNIAKPMLPKNIYHFVVLDNKILFGQDSSESTDIYQTQSLNK